MGDGSGSPELLFGDGPPTEYPGGGAFLVFLVFWEFSWARVFRGVSI